MSSLPALQEAAGPGRSVGYLSLEAPREGQAAHTHIHAIIDGLEAQGWRVTPFLATRTGVSAGRSLLAKLVDYVAVQACLIAALPRLDAVYVRAHPAAWPASLVARWCGRPVVHEINGPHGELAVTYPWLKPFARLVAALQRAHIAARRISSPSRRASSRGQRPKPGMTASASCRMRRMWSGSRPTVPAMPSAKARHGLTRFSWAAW